MKTLTALFLLHLPCHAIDFASGVKIGEVTDTSAVLWTRLTKNEQGENRVDERKADVPKWTVPGMEGMMEFSIREPDKELQGTLIATLKASAVNDFCVQKTVTGLKPAT